MSSRESQPEHRPRPQIVGILNLTEDSFSDGGRYLSPDEAIAQARALHAAGADWIECGPASSHPDARAVSPAEEIRRLEPVLRALRAEGLPIAVDSFQPETQRFAAEHGAELLNDIQGFPDAQPWLAESGCRLVVMYAVQGRGKARRVSRSVEQVMKGLHAFFEERVAQLTRLGVAPDRLVLDPGMGFFLGDAPEPSIAVLRAVPALRARFGLPLLISVSRKSFLGALTGRAVQERGAATLAAELYAARAGVDYIRTHDPAALRDGLAIEAALA